MYNQIRLFSIVSLAFFTGYMVGDAVRKHEFHEQRQKDYANYMSYVDSILDADAEQKMDGTIVLIPIKDQND